MPRSQSKAIVSVNEDYLNVLLITLLCALMVGGGWTFVVFGMSKSIVFCSATTFLFAATAASLSWCWVYGLGGAIREVTIMIVVLAVIGWVAALLKFKNGSLKTADDERFKYRLVDFGMVLAIIGATFFVGIFPKMDTPTTLTMTFRTGPDAIGNSIAVDAMLRDGSRMDLINKIVESYPAVQSIDEIMDQRFKRIYQITSISISAKAEFIIGGLRWGFSGVNASVLSVIGLKNLWATIALLPALSVLFGSLLIYECLRSKKLSPTFASVCTICALINVNFLHGWHEGGLAQAWVFISISTLLVIQFHPHLMLTQRLILGSSAAVTALLGYSDWFIVFFSISLLAVFISLIFSQLRVWTKDAFLVIGSLVFGAIASAPFFVQFIRYLPRRLKDAGIGGWPMPIWTSPAENIGIFNPYNAHEGHPGASALIVLIANAAAIAIILRVLIRGNFTSPKIFFGAVTLLLLLIAAKTGLVDQTSNYQYFKAVGILSPSIFPLLGLIVGAQKKDRLNRLLITSLCLCSVIASCNYILHYRQTSIRLPNAIASQLLESNNGRRFDSYDILTTSEFAHPEVPPYNAWIFTPFMDSRFINRNTTGLLIDNHKPHKLAVIINKDNCENWICIENVDQAYIGALTPQYKIMLFDQPSMFLMGSGSIDYNRISKIISMLSTKINGPAFNVNLIPI